MAGTTPAGEQLVASPALTVWASDPADAAAASAAVRMTAAAYADEEMAEDAFGEWSTGQPAQAEAPLDNDDDYGEWHGGADKAGGARQAQTEILQ